MAQNTKSPGYTYKKFRVVSIPSDLVAAAEAVVTGEDRHGYTSASALMADAIRRRLEELRRPKAPQVMSGDFVEYKPGMN